MAGPLRDRGAGPLRFPISVSLLEGQAGTSPPGAKGEGGRLSGSGYGRCEIGGSKQRGVFVGAHTRGPSPLFSINHPLLIFA